MNSINEQDVVDYIQRKMYWLFSSECPAKYSVAGGVFKELINGNTTSDIDLWCPNEEELKKLRRFLTDIGATELPLREYTFAYSINGTVLEIKNKTIYPTLESVISQFDLGLSAIGAEYDGNGNWRAFIHPIHNKSMQEKKVLLLKPLANWKYALTTLERMRRYAAELNYESTAVEEQEIWRVFLEQDQEMQHGMIDRFRRTSRGDDSVLTKALKRMNTLR